MVPVRSASAFCPGHITGFFQIWDLSDETHKKGSIGSGFNTAVGVTTKASFTQLVNTEKIVETIPGTFLSIYSNGRVVETHELMATRDMISRFFNLYGDSAKLWDIGDRKICLVLDSLFDLPLSQGFGMSGAGLISQILALNRLFDSPFSKEVCIQMAHHSEIVHGTGLGDIPAQSVGGLTIREREGLPPYGKIHGLPLNNRVILAVLGSRMPTRNIILDEAKRNSINRHSEGMVDKLLAQLASNSGDDQLFDPGSVSSLLAEMTSLSFRFARDTGLMNAEIHELCRKINKIVSPGSSMCMLGNSIFVIFPEETSSEDKIYKKVKSMLIDSGEIFETAISPRGATLL